MKIKMERKIEKKRETQNKSQIDTRHANRYRYSKSKGKRQKKNRLRQSQRKKNIDRQLHIQCWKEKEKQTLDEQEVKEETRNA